MIKLETILENYDEWETFLDDRFGTRLASFLREDQLHFIHKKRSEKNADKPLPEPKEWNEENILKQLKEDVEFAWEKACNQRGISASLMVDVVQKWCNVLENGLAYGDYNDYGKAFLQQVDNFYGWHLTDKDVSEPDYVKKMWAQGMNVIETE